MKTDDLISLLAQDAPIRTRLGPLLLGALLIGVAVSAALLLAAVGIRHDMASAIETARVLFKMVLALTLAVTACGLVFRIGRPGVPLRHSSLALFVPLILLAGGTAAELSAIPQDSWETAMLGRNAGFCPVLHPGPIARAACGFPLGAEKRCCGTPKPCRCCSRPCRRRHSGSALRLTLHGRQPAVSRSLVHHGNRGSDSHRRAAWITISEVVTQQRSVTRPRPLYRLFCYLCKEMVPRRGVRKA